MTCVIVDAAVMVSLSVSLGKPLVHVWVVMYLRHLFRTSVGLTVLVFKMALVLTYHILLLSAFL
jgi:hypothetical protein